MKTLIILLLCVFPFIAFSQAMHLPGTSLHKQKTVKILALPDTSKLKLGATEYESLKTVALSSTDTSQAGTASSPIKYKATVLSTNFVIPLLRLNLLNKTPGNSSNALLSSSFLNSAGAGFNYSWGKLEETLDANGNTASTDFYNRFGLQLGFLFAANSSSSTSATTTTSTSSTSSSQSSTIFAVVAGVSVLNFQVGGGYELGSLSPGQKRVFFTLSYAIPMSTLINGGYKIFHLEKLPENSLY
ncbi:MAG TPA: hypothetical protein VNX40_14500 [Mucilaginibacter sp.]|jgi:hypothetical protein|nr:hypothetical protein [Mucilaginibacter sp.]